MIVVAIIGILAAIALPAYHDYVVRSRVSEIMTTADSVKTLVGENAANGKALDSGFVAKPATENQEAMAAGDVDGTNGTITLKTTAKSGGAGKTVLFIPYDGAVGGANLVSGTVPANPIQWDCTTGTLDAKYRPAQCRP